MDRSRKKKAAKINYLVDVLTVRGQPFNGKPLTPWFRPRKLAQEVCKSYIQNVNINKTKMGCLFTALLENLVLYFETRKIFFTSSSSSTEQEPTPFTIDDFEFENG